MASAVATAGAPSKHALALTALIPKLLSTWPVVPARVVASHQMSVVHTCSRLVAVAAPHPANAASIALRP